MGIFGGKNEDELRATGTPTSARVTYVDDTDKRRNGGGEARVKVRVQIEEGSARGRELEKTKWVPVIAMPHVGDRISVRIDTDDPDDWAWGDIRMYQPNVGQATTMPVTSSNPAPPPAPVPGQMIAPGQSVPGNHPIAKMFGMQAAFDLADLPKMVQQAMAQQQQFFAQGGGAGQPIVYDARNMPQLRAQILNSLKQYGVDVEAMQASGQLPTAPASPAMPAMPAAGAAPAAGASPTDVTSRLKRLDDLRAQGLLTEAEHAEQRQRIIDEI